MNSGEAQEQSATSVTKSLPEDVLVCLVVPASGGEPLTLVDVSRANPNYESLVGDRPVGALFLRDLPALCYLADNGKGLGYPCNARATAIAEAFLPGFVRHDWIAGTAVFFGTSAAVDDDDDEGLADVPIEIVRGATTNAIVISQGERASELLIELLEPPRVPSVDEGEA